MRRILRSVLTSPQLITGSTLASRLINPAEIPPVPSTGGTWAPHQVTVNGFVLPYQLYVPTTATPGSLPLIIHLHGTGEAGTDNGRQMLAGTRYGPQYFTLSEHQQVQAAYVLAPQTPVDIRWASTGIPEYDLATTPETPSMTALVSLIPQLLQANPGIDPDRIYLVGLSRGGQGVWNALMRHPDLFAAAVPISGSGSPADAGILKNMAIWAFHAQDDHTTKVDYTRHMVDAIYRAGGTSALLRYTEVEYGDHQAGWDTAYKTSEVYRWLIKWRR